MQNSSEISRKYTTPARLLHWLMAIIWIAVWIIGYIAVTWREEINPHHGLTTAHKALASTLLFLIVLRVFWRLTHRPPALPDSMSPLMQRAAHWGHLFLYVFALIAMPLSGWLWSSVAGKPVTVLWLFPLPPLVDANPDYYALMKDIHVTLAYCTGALVLGHILIALKHAIIDKDGVVQSMLSGRHTASGRKK